MKSKNLMIIAVLLFLSGSIFAQGQEGFRQGKFENKGFMNIPDLTEAQKTKLQDMRTANMKEMLPIRNELKEKEARLHTLSTGEKVNMDEVSKLIDEIGAIKTSTAKKRAKHHQEIRLSLTEDQRVFFDMHAGPKRNCPNMGPRK
jgi:Spy/CpxP family protein refolding chaperone